MNHWLTDFNYPGLPCIAIQLVVKRSFYTDLNITIRSAKEVSIKIAIQCHRNLLFFFVIVQNGIYGLILFLKFVILKFLQCIYIFFNFLQLSVELKFYVMTATAVVNFSTTAFQPQPRFSETHIRPITSFNYIILSINHSFSNSFLLPSKNELKVFVCT